MRLAFLTAVLTAALSSCTCTPYEPCDAGTCRPGLVCSPHDYCRPPCAQGSDCPTDCACVLFRSPSDGGGNCEPSNVNGGC
ncbi:MAG: hypothetical protein JNM17_17695 [Archangium sp.]|nr:hypothetical protein [Archangium sp.]